MEVQTYFVNYLTVTDPPHLSISNAGLLSTDQFHSWHVNNLSISRLVQYQLEFTMEEAHAAPSPPKKSHTIRKITFSTSKSGATGVPSMSYRMFRASPNFNIWHSGGVRKLFTALLKNSWILALQLLLAAVFGAQLWFESLQREIFVFSDTDILWSCQGFHLSLCHSSSSSCCSLSCSDIFFSQSFFFLFPPLCLACCPSLCVFVSQIC